MEYLEPSDFSQLEGSGEEEKDGKDGLFDVDLSVLGPCDSSSGRFPLLLKTPSGRFGHLEMQQEDMVGDLKAKFNGIPGFGKEYSEGSLDLVFGDKVWGGE